VSARACACHFRFYVGIFFLLCCVLEMNAIRILSFPPFGFFLQSRSMWIYGSLLHDISEVGLSADQVVF